MRQMALMLVGAALVIIAVEFYGYAEAVRDPVLKQHISPIRSGRRDDRMSVSSLLRTSISTVQQ